MHKVFFWRIILISLLINSGLAAQEAARISFLNGKVIHVDSVSYDSIEICFHTKASQKKKLRCISTSHVFSVTDKEANELVFYTPQHEGERTVEDMYQFLQGQQDAKNSIRSNFIASWWFMAGVVSGSALGLVVHTDIALAPLPIVLPLAAHLNGVNLNAYPLELKSQAYIEGFEKEIRSKRVYRALQGAVIGSLSGLIISNSTR